MTPPRDINGGILVLILPNSPTNRVPDYRALAYIAIDEERRDKPLGLFVAVVLWYLSRAVRGWLFLLLQLKLFSRMIPHERTRGCY